MDFKNKTVVITGGSRGIGLSCAKTFFEEGANVAILDKDSPVLSPEDSPGILPGSARWFYYKSDVSKAEEVKAAMTVIYENFGSIDFLVNNAGIQRYGSVTETSEEVWDLVMNVNLKSYYLCAKYAIEYMNRNSGGVIVNISSVQAFVSQQKVAAYATAKTAILGLTRSIAIDYAPEIRCVAVCPGTIDTPMLRRSLEESPDPAAVMKECEDMHLLQRIGRPEEISGLVKFLCSDAAGFITGEAIRADGGLGIMIQGSKKD